MNRGSGERSRTAAIAKAALALRDVPPTERVADVSIGQFSEDVGGGWYWSVSVIREIGNTRTALHPHPQDEASRLRLLEQAAARTEVSP